MIDSTARVLRTHFELATGAPTFALCFVEYTELTYDGPSTKLSVSIAGAIEQYSPVMLVLPTAAAGIARLARAADDFASSLCFASLHYASVLNKVTL